MPLLALADHVAVAVPDLDDALQRWRDQLRGALVSRFRNPAFHAVQLVYPVAPPATGRGAKLELIAPAGGGPSFLRSYLDRFGAGIHHVTLKVDDLGQAIATAEAAGFDVVDVDRSNPRWQEAFLRPSQVGGIVVQVAQSPLTDAQWAAITGTPSEPVAVEAPALLGPRLAHPDLDTAASVWTTLGASMRSVHAPSTDTCARVDGFTLHWPNSRLEVEVVAGDEPGPVALRFRGAPVLPPDRASGPGVVGPTLTVA